MQKQLIFNFTKEKFKQFINFEKEWIGEWIGCMWSQFNIVGKTIFLPLTLFGILFVPLMAPILCCIMNFMLYNESFDMETIFMKRIIKKGSVEAELFGGKQTISADEKIEVARFYCGSHPGSQGIIHGWRNMPNGLWITVDYGCDEGGQRLLKPYPSNVLKLVDGNIKNSGLNDESLPDVKLARAMTVKYRGETFKYPKGHSVLPDLDYEDTHICDFMDGYAWKVKPSHLIFP